MTRSTKRLISVGVFVIAVPVLYWIWIFEMMWPVVAYHVLDVPADKTGWFSFFYRASWCVPVLWGLSCVLLVVEAAIRKRWPRFLFYAAVPFAGAAIYWVAWQAFLIYLSRTLAYQSAAANR